MRRKRMSRRASRRLFRKTASRIHPYNVRKYVSRGGIRL